MTPRPIQNRASYRRPAAILATMLLTAACVTQAKTPPEPPPPPVSVVAAEERDIPLEAAYTGRVEAVHTVELRPGSPP